MNSPNGAGPPDSLSTPQDAKSNPSNGLVERVARIVEPEAFAIDPEVFATRIYGSASLGKLLAAESQLRRRTTDAFSKAREIHALYQQEGVLSGQRGEALESILAKLGVVETIMVNKGWHRQAVGGYLTDAGLWLDRAMSELRKLVSHAEGENRSANASLRPGLLGPDTEVVGSAAVRELTGEDLAEGLSRAPVLAQLPALILANIEDSPNWRDSWPLLTAHAHAWVLHDDLLRALATPWQPIETAPRDGTTILVAHASNGAIFDAAWENGAWVDGSTDNYDEPVAFHPSHWMPLPSPPASPATPIGGLSLGVEGDQGASVASRGGTAQAPKSDNHNQIGEE